MASIARRSDGRWRARYRDDAGRERSRHFERKVDAQRWLDEVTASMVTGQYVDPAAGRITLADYSKEWEAAQVGRAGTARITDNALRLHIVPRLGTRPMASIRHSDVQGLVKALSETHSPGSVRNVYERLQRIFAAAVRDRVVPVSPCQGIRLPKAPDEEVQPPTIEEVATAIDAAPGRYRAPVVLLAGAGLRVGELLGLRVPDVDFLRRTVRVERQRLQSGEIGPVKSARSVRTVPLAQQVVEELAAHLAAYPSDEWLFLTEAGQPLGYLAWRSMWRALRARAGLEIGTHDLRHFFASALIAGGASVKQVQTLLGHSSAVITLRTYAHLWPGDEDRARTIIEDVLDGLRTTRGLEALPGQESPGQGL